MLLIELFLLLTCACAYVTRCLVFEDKSEPWPSSLRVVKWEDGEGRHEKPVSLFDHIRRLFGCYKIEKHIWFVNAARMPVFECSFCLSFWVALFLCVPALLYFQYPLVIVPLFVLAVSGASQKVMP